MKFTADDFKMLFLKCQLPLQFSDPETMTLLGIRGSMADKYMTDSSVLPGERL